MITGNVVRQHLSLSDSHVVADTIDYLEAKFVFKTDNWNGLDKWAHFINSGGTVYDIPLIDDCIRKEDHLNLSAGIWKVYLHGNEFHEGKVVQRITTDEAILYVNPTGTIDREPFPTIPASVAEQILARLEDIEQSDIEGEGISYIIGSGLNLNGRVLSAEVGKDSFAEIPNAKIQEIFNKVMGG